MSSTPLISTGQLATLRRVANSAMVSPCTITRDGVLLDPQPTMPDGSPLQCRVRDDTREHHTSDLPPIQAIRRWIVNFPTGTDIRVNDLVTVPALDRRYFIEQVRNPLSIDPQVTCFAYITSTAAGASTQGLVTNAVVSSLYGAMPKLTNLAVYLEAPTEKDMATFGGIVRYVMLLPPGSDIVVGDAIYIQSWGLNTVNPQKAYHVFSADPSGALGQEVIRAVIGERVQR